MVGRCAGSLFEDPSLKIVSFPSMLQKAIGLFVTQHDFLNMSFKVTLPFFPLLTGANLISNAVRYLTAVLVREDVCVQ